MQVKPLIILLILLTIPVQAGIIYVRFLDLTNNQYDYIDVYQRDATSTRYIKTINISVQDMETLSTNINYTLVLHPNRKDILYDVSNPRQLSYLLQELPQYIFYGVIIGLLALILRRK